jgi:hypothetical protein
VGLNIGVYNITIVIQDINGNKASDTVIIEVWDVMMTSTPEFIELKWIKWLVVIGLILFFIPDIKNNRVKFYFPNEICKIFGAFHSSLRML